MADPEAEGEGDAESCPELHPTFSSCQVLWGCRPLPSRPIRILKVPIKGSKGDQNINSLTPIGPHDVLMWNTDNKKSQNLNNKLLFATQITSPQRCVVFQGLVL